MKKLFLLLTIILVFLTGCYKQLNFDNLPSELKDEKKLVLPETYEGKTVYFISSDEGVIDSFGNIYYDDKDHKVTITIIVEGYVDYKFVVLVKAREYINLENLNLDLKGQERILEDLTYKGKTLKLFSSNLNIIDSNGYIHYDNNSHQINITFSAEGFLSKTHTFNVFPKMEKINLDIITDLYGEENINVPESYKGKNLTFESLDETVIDNTGRVYYTNVIKTVKLIFKCEGYQDTEILFTVNPKEEVYYKLSFDDINKYILPEDIDINKVLKNRHLKIKIKKIEGNVLKYLKINNIDKTNIVNLETLEFEVQVTANLHFEIKYEKGDPLIDEYYKEAKGLKGNHLFVKLNQIISRNTNPVTYNDIKQILVKADAKIGKPNVLHGIYNNEELVGHWDGGESWNREHVWPNSRLGIPRVEPNEVSQGSDPHNLRACNKNVNSERNNNYYVDGSGPIGYIPYGRTYYPGDSHKGDVARILMYMVVRYKDILDLVKKPSGPNYHPEGAKMGDLTIFYKWHLEDPVDEFEKRRNNVIYSYQNNRNPFIDKPDLFLEVWKYLMQRHSYDISQYVSIINRFNNLIKVDLSYINKNTKLYM